MGIVHEKFWLWRLKLLPVALALVFMLISLLKRAFIYFVFSVVAVVLFAQTSNASTWNDVLNWLNTHTAPSGCVYFVTKTATPSWRIWKRCNNNANAFYDPQLYLDSATQTQTAGHWGFACNGASMTAQTLTAPDYYCPGCYWRKQMTTCNGLSGSLVPAAPGDGLTVNYFQTKPCTVARVTTGTNCASSDVLEIEYSSLTDNCNYANMSSMGATTSSGTGYDYAINYPPAVGVQYPCNICIPDGTKPDTGFAGNSAQAPFGQPNADGTISCVYKDTVGDPAQMSDSWSPPASGGGNAGDTGQPAVVDTQSTSSSSTVGGTTETTTVSTTTVTTQDGGSTTTTTTRVSNCIDADSDGKSDISGQPCTGTIQTTTAPASGGGSPSQGDGMRTGTAEGGGGTAAWYPTLTAPAGYSNSSLTAKGISDINSRFTQFFNDVKNTPLFSQFSLSAMAPSGGGSSTVNLDFGRYGQHNLDLYNYSTALSYIKGFMLLLASYLAVRVVIMKR